MQRIVINTKYPGFRLSQTAYQRLAELGIPVKAWNERLPDESDAVIYDFNEGKLSDRRLEGGCLSHWFDRHRDDPRLVQVVEELGDAANGEYAGLKIVEIPDDVKWEIQEDNGNEWVAEVHRTWEYGTSRRSARNGPSRPK